MFEYRLFCINCRKILLIEFELLLYIKLFSYVFPTLKFFELIFDLSNVIIILLLFVVHHKSAVVKSWLLFILFFCGYCILEFFFLNNDIFLFCWGMRNIFRFFIMFYAAITFLTIDDILLLFKKMYLCLILNIIIITIQFLVGVDRDCIGGSFGLEKNCNAITNVFLVATFSYYFVMTLSNKESKYKLLVVTIGSLYWALLAELKIFFVEFFIIVCLCMLFIGKGKTKFILANSFLFLFIISYFVMSHIYPEQAEFIVNPSSILWYLQHVNGGAYGFGRTTALSMSYVVFFNSDIIKTIFGLGVGGAEFINVFGLEYYSDFYLKYVEYAYFGYFLSMTFIQTGFIGLIWFVLFFVKILNIIMKIRSINPELSLFSFVFFICILICAFKDSSLNISICGYISFIFLAIPCICYYRRLKRYS